MSWGSHRQYFPYEVGGFCVSSSKRLQSPWVLKKAGHPIKCNVSCMDVTVQLVLQIPPQDMCLSTNIQETLVFYV